MDKQAKITGYFERVIFQNADNFYTVAVFYTEDQQLEDIVVVGHIPDLDFELEYTLYGKFVEHPTYGIQYSFTNYNKAVASDKESLIKFLSSSLFPSIGKVSAEVIYEALGDDLINLIREDVSIVDNLKISEKQKAVLKKGVLDNSHDFEHLVSYLSALGLGINSIINIEKAYGDVAIQKIEENPYRLMEDIVGIGFKTCEKVASNLNFDKQSLYRAEAMLIDIVLNYMSAYGDSFVDVEILNDLYTKKALAHPLQTVLMQLLKRRVLIMEDNRVYHHTQFDSEEIIAHVLSLFTNEKDQHIDENLVDELLTNLQTEKNIIYDESQLLAIKKFLSADFSILTGGPGTGKTTIVNAMVNIYQKIDKDVKIALMAPTGRAAKRLSELASSEAFTIHSLLKWDLNNNTFGRNQDQPLDYDILIIDEFSMVDQWLFSKLLEACVNVKKILVVGDENQLPSVLPGALLSDLIESELFPLARLSKIYRQKADSSVVYLADKINKDDYEHLEFKDDTRFIEASANQVDAGIIQIIENYLKQDYNISDIQVLAPMYRRGSGINILNNKIQQLVNPRRKDKNEFKYGYRTFRENDKVLQLKNIVDLDVYNGDIGIIVEIDKSDPYNVSVLIDFDGNLVSYSNENINNITLAYCISIHKSQGSEYPIVIMPIVKSSTFMLRKRLLYTAITRAKRNLILIGDKDLFYTRIKKGEDHIRKTSLVERLLKYQ